MIWRWLKHIWRFKRRLAVWLPVIWQDEDWDSAYLLRIMQVKIRMMRLDMQRCQLHTDWKHDVRKMLIAEQLLERLGSDNYYHDHFQAMKSDHCECPKVNPFSDEYISPDGKWLWQPCFYCKHLLTKVYNKKEEQDIDYLFDLLKTEYRKWWT